MKIGQGLQFNVYDKGNYVEKIPTSKIQIKLKLLLWQPFYLFKLSALEQESRKVIQERDKIIKEITKRRINRYLLANLEIKNNQIKQNKVIPLGNKLNKKIINKYINFIFRCWKNGFSERTFNFTINNGINKREDIVLLDFGELTFDKNYIKKEIKIKRWLRSWSFKHINKDLKEYYKNQMQKKLTIANLNKYWRTK